MKKVFKINTKYALGHQVEGRHISATGHWVFADDIDDALRIAREYKIGWPMGSDAAIDWTYSEGGSAFFEYGRKFNGSVFEEVDGELIRHITPFERPES